MTDDDLLHQMIARTFADIDRRLEALEQGQANLSVAVADLAVAEDGWRPPTGHK